MHKPHYHPIPKTPSTPFQKAKQEEVLIMEGGKGGEDKGDVPSSRDPDS